MTPRRGARGWAGTGPPFREAAGPSFEPQAQEPRRRLSARRCCPLLGTLRRPLWLWERLRAPWGRGGGRLGADPPRRCPVCSRLESARGPPPSLGRIRASSQRFGRLARPAVERGDRGGLRGLRRGLRPPALPVPAGP